MQPSRKRDRERETGERTVGERVRATAETAEHFESCSACVREREGEGDGALGQCSCHSTL